MRNFKTIMLGLAVATSFAMAPASLAKECARGGCKPASQTVQGKTSNVKGGTKAQFQTETRYKNVVQVKHVTKYVDVTKTKYRDIITTRTKTTYIQPIKRITVVTYIQPINQIRTVMTVSTKRVNGTPCKAKPCK